jgi:hypothetical protein
MHTFGTLLIPLAFACVSLGFYLLGSELRHPLVADSAMLLTSSILLSLGFLLLSYLLRSSMAGKHAARSLRPQNGVGEARQKSGEMERRLTEAPQSFHRRYVDSARVRR